MMDNGSFRFPGGDSRCTIIGATGSGKSTCGLWMLSHQRFDRRPWIAVDFKREEQFDKVGFPPIRQISLDDKIPRKPGLYLVSPVPGQDDWLESFLWRVWQRENCGLFIDEAMLMPQGDAFPAILQQGRSKRIPVIACSQRPVGVARGLFSEASFICVYRLVDKRDYKIVEGFAPVDLSAELPRHHWYWYDVARHVQLAMSPVPPPDEITETLNAKLPYTPSGWHPFTWTSRPTGRAAGGTSVH
jgi:hypothetical protein